MTKFLARGLMMVLAALMLASCGGGGDDAVALPGISSYTLTVATVDASTGTPVTQTSAAAPLRIVATLLAPTTGAPVPGATIQFGATVGRLAGGSAQTDGAGVASVVLNAGSTGPAAGTVTILFTDPAGNVATAAQAVTTTGDESTGTGGTGGTGGTPTTAGLSITLVARDGAGNAISTTNPVTSLNPGRLIATVTLDGAPVNLALVTFTSPTVAELSQATTATTAAGVAEVSLTPLSSGAGITTATVDYLGQTATSSVVIVTSVTATAPVVLQLGSFNGATFSNAVLKASATAAIQAGSTITVSADVVDAGTGLAYTTPIPVAFTSDCASLATPTAIIDATGTTVAGHTDITYRPNGCVGTDIIRATITNGASTLSAQVTVSIAAATVGQIAFISATPDVIALEGTGGFGRLTRSEVKFRVLGNDGTPISNQLVCFGLSTSVGGLTVNASSPSDSAGDVIAVVQAGSVPTSVRVNAVVDYDNDANCATVPSPAKSAVSDVLVVSTGLPHQDSFSLSIGTFNPQAGDYDGVTVPVFIYAADHFSNPVPDGTAVTFWSELGSIEPSCTTVNGTCSVNWRSQDLRGNADARAPGATPAGNGLSTHDRLNRSTIVAYAVGEESFQDINGNGRYDVGETYTDLAETVKDSNYNGVRDTPAQVGTTFASQFKDEEFVDFDQNSAFDAANGRFDGVLCATGTASTACSGDATVNVRDSALLVMSTDAARIYIVHPNVDLSAIDYTRDTTSAALNGIISGMIQPPVDAFYTQSGQEISGVVVHDGSARSVGVIVTDAYGNAPPKGTTVKAEVNPSGVAEIVGAATATVGSQTEYFATSFLVARPTTFLIADGSLIITVTPPNGNAQTTSITIDGTP